MLAARGVSAKERSQDTKWRKLSAECAQIRDRLKVVAGVADREATAAQRKAEKLAAPKAPSKSKGKSSDKAAKPKKEKKPKAEKGAKGG